MVKLPESLATRQARMLYVTACREERGVERARAAYLLAQADQFEQEAQRLRAEAATVETDREGAAT